MSSKPLVHLFENHGDCLKARTDKDSKGSHDLREVTCKQCLGTDLRFSTSDRAWTQHINQIRQEKYLKER